MNLKQELKRLQQRLIELSTWRIQSAIPLKKALFKASDMPEPVNIEPGQIWPSQAFPVRMRFTARVPVEWSKRSVWVKLSIGGEGILTRGGRAIGGLDPHHREIQLLKVAQGGEELNLEIEAVPRGPFGAPQREPKLNTAALFIADADVLPLCDDIVAVLEAAEYVEPEIALFLLGALRDVFATLPLPRSPSEAYMAHFIKAPHSAGMIANLWEDWEFSEPPLPLPDSLRPKIRQARAHLRGRLDTIRCQHPPSGQLYLSAHAHLDLAWLWPLTETRRKARRSFASVLSLMEQYPKMTYNQSMSQLYAFIEEDDPELFSRLKARVDEGRWEPIGGMWVEPDGNLLSGESWARQLLYGQGYFESRFGRRARVAWLPDTFGFAANLPQIFSQAGLDYFFTHKLTWNETNEFPYHLYWWEGLDGTRILAHIFHNPGGYNSTLNAGDLLSTWKNYKGKRHYPESLLTFGWGDGGGGPTREMLERYQRFQDFPGLPRLRIGRVETFYQEANEKILQVEKEKRAASRLPVWVGEKYLELHRATYTTQARIKSLNRRLEHTLPEAEIASSLVSISGTAYPKLELERAWKVLLRNQFHDILPGSSIRTVVEEAEQEMSSTLEQVASIRSQALETLSRSTAGQPNTAIRVVVWNLSLDSRPLRVSFPHMMDVPFHILSPDNAEIPHQISEGLVLAAHETQVPGLGYITLSLIRGQGKKSESLRASATMLENQYLRAEIASDGTLESLFDKKSRREVLDGRGNQIWAYTDLPREWDAWDIDASYSLEG
ncbi:MAG: glycoside hydrolase family 38 C-terminal domain-containing protein, partial [Anaerolineales bacterium]